MLKTFLSQVEVEKPRLQQALDWSRSLLLGPLDGLVGLQVEDPLLFAVAFLSVLQGGGCPVLMPTDEEASQYGLTARITQNGLEVLSALPQLEVQSQTFWGFSSGSTGLRRPLRFWVERALGNARAHALSLGVKPETPILQTLRMHHPFGVVAYIFTPLVSGARLWPGVFFESLFLQAPPEQSLVHLTPYHLQSLLRRPPRSPIRVAKLSLGAGPLQRSQALAALALCQELYVTYGLSEGGPRVTTGRVVAETFVDGWIGHLLEGVEARLDERDSLWIRTPYHADSERSGADFFDTGDRVNRLPDGSLVFRDRLLDVLRLRGQTYPRSLYNERLSRQLGRPCVVGQQPYSDALQIFCEGPADFQASQGAMRQYPELKGAQWTWCEAFPRTVLGKVDLGQLMRPGSE